MTSPRAESPIATSSRSRPRVPRVLVVFGTRPEAIKLAPVISDLRCAASSGNFEIRVCVTAQHREMLDQVLGIFDVQPEFDLNLMQPGQTLSELTARLVPALSQVFAAVKPALSIVQGDTTTTFCASLASFYSGVPIAHVEAGLRTRDPQAPFPEEMNRVLTSRLAALHFAPTPLAAFNLEREGIERDRIEVTGNTGIDALLQVRTALTRGTLKSGAPRLFRAGVKLILVTAHRREILGPALAEICRGLAELSRRPDVHIVWPVHPNPEVRKTVLETEFDPAAVSLIEPLDYVSFIDLLATAYFVITDSGGVQEEAPSLGKPVLVLRDHTERPEGVEAGTARLVGTGSACLVREAGRLLDDPEEYQRRSEIKNPYGDGRASQRISERIRVFLEC
ncbi:MAG: UDP-N-acetylglucosamine 2-epimerase (non-hydrolyzing) [Acidobacteriaceae bacterium]|nr:UDP-N-acetylglucosamine 2-epimerase (non-hydrolyzing) [Acidobacteriaceae bacterium]